MYVQWQIRPSFPIATVGARASLQYGGADRRGLQPELFPVGVALKGGVTIRKCKEPGYEARAAYRSSTNRVISAQPASDVFC